MSPNKPLVRAGENLVGSDAASRSLPVAEDTLSTLRSDATRKSLARAGEQLLGTGSMAKSTDCPGCGRSFGSRDLLLTHLAQPSERRSPPCQAALCPGCKVAFATEADCAAHGDVCPLILPCPGCSLKFTSEKLLQAHVASSRCPARACCGCGALCASDAACLAHEISCPKAFVCPGCESRFPHEGLLLKHFTLSPAHRNGCEAAACVGCRKPHANARLNFLHEEMCWHVFMCPGCDGHFGSIQSLELHVDEVIQARECGTKATGSCAGQVANRTASNGFSSGGSRPSRPPSGPRPSVDGAARTTLAASGSRPGSGARPAADNSLAPGSAKHPRVSSSPSSARRQPADSQELQARPPDVGSGPSASDTLHRDSAGTHRKGDHVEYYSGTHKEWLDATVLAHDDEGRICIDLKPKTWISLDTQASQIRPQNYQVQQQPGIASESAAGAVVTQCEIARCDICGMLWPSVEECDSHRQQHAQKRIPRRPPPGPGTELVPAKAKRSPRVPRPESEPRALPEPYRALPDPDNPEEARSARTSEHRRHSASPAPAAAASRRLHPEVEAMCAQIEAEVDALAGVEKRRRLRQLQLQWHPDHAHRHQGIWAEDSNLLCSVFVFVQSLWERSK